MKDFFILYIMNKYFLILLVSFNYLLSFQDQWSSTPIDKFINNNFRKMTYREPFYLIPYEVKMGYYFLMAVPIILIIFFQETLIYSQIQLF